MPAHVARQPPHPSSTFTVVSPHGINLTLVLIFIHKALTSQKLPRCRSQSKNRTNAGRGQASRRGCPCSLMQNSGGHTAQQAQRTSCQHVDATQNSAQHMHAGTVAVAALVVVVVESRSSRCARSLLFAFCSSSIFASPAFLAAFSVSMPCAVVEVAVRLVAGGVHVWPVSPWARRHRAQTRATTLRANTLCRRPRWRRLWCQFLNR